MSKRNSEAIISAVREQYEAFPYPPLETISQEDPARDLRASFNLDFYLERERSLKPGARIWVPGCGTRWAVMMALQFGDVEILATDLSSNNLAKHEQLARSLGLSNIEFRRENLLEASYQEQFDYISCVGVLHHLPDPGEGFGVISRALKGSGLAEVMVYDRLNRRYSIRMRAIIDTFDPNAVLSAEARFTLAEKLLRSLNKYASAPRELKRILEYLDTAPGFRSELADFISHPQEHYFDVPSLVESLRAVRLRPRAWRPPYRFDPKFMLGDKGLWAEIDEMDALHKAHLGHLLGAGLLEVFVEHSDNALGIGQQPDLAARRVRAIPDGLLYRIDDGGQITKSERRPKIAENEHGLWIDGGERRPAVAAYGTDLDCIKPGHRRLLKITDLGFNTPLLDEHIQAIVKLAVRPTTIGEIAEAISCDKTLAPASAFEIGRLCDQLCRTPFRVLATIA